MHNAPVRRTVIAMNTKSAITEPYTESRFWYQQIDLGQTRILRSCQPIVDFNSADNCHLYVTTMKALIFHNDLLSIPIDNIKDRNVLVFDLTSMQDASVNSHYPELKGEPMRLELNFTFPLEHVTEPFVLGERMPWDEVDRFDVV